jgi:hypothetical protein
MKREKFSKKFKSIEEQNKSTQQWLREDTPEERLTTLCESLPVHPQKMEDCNDQHFLRTRQKNFIFWIYNFHDMISRLN